MQVEYKTVHYATSKEVTQREDLYSWLDSRLDSGGIEVQIKKIRELVLIMVAKHLQRHPEDIEAVAHEIADDDYTYHHKIVESNE